MDYKIKNQYLSFFDIYKYSYWIYKKNFINIIKICLFIFIPLFFITMLFPDYYEILLNNINILNMEYANTILINIIFMIAITIAFNSMLIGAVTHIVINYIENKKINFYTMLDNSLLKWYKLAVTNILYVLSIAIYAILIVPAVFFGILFCFAVPSVLVTDGKVLQAFKLSIKLVKNKWFSLFYFFVMTFIMNNLLIFFIVFMYQLLFGIGSTLLPVLDNNIVIFIFNLLEFLFSQVIGAYFTLVVSLKFINLYYMFKLKG